jgi:hypothetical protein
MTSESKAVDKESIFSSTVQKVFIHSFFLLYNDDLWSYLNKFLSKISILIGDPNISIFRFHDQGPLIIADEGTIYYIYLYTCHLYLIYDNLILICRTINVRSFGDIVILNIWSEF